MKNRILFLILFGILGTTQVLSQIKSHDNRYHLGLNAEEKVEFLSEMRQMLFSIQQIMLGIGTGDKAMVIKAAQYSGNRMARATPQAIKDKTPVSFERIGAPTHMMFEELVIRAETDDMESLAELTGELMKNCVTCHAMFKSSE
jgi:sensor histidine kinase regulating citrate/malate metabolism